MLGIRFLERSLLFGYSIQWLFVTTVFPSIDLPRIGDSKHCHIFDKLPPFVRDNVSRESPHRHWYHLSFVYKLFRLYELSSFAIYYALLILISFRVQGILLATFGITQVETLTYKALYYSPILHVSQFSSPLYPLAL